jgi:peptidoglycan L-alanyl-D-glutamate endopeptidase CwlK
MRVTEAIGGRSWHNFRLAYDIAIFDARGRYVEDGSDWRYQRAGEIGERVGLEWGGRWSKPDASHFQVTNGRSISDARREWEAERGAR